MSDVTSTSAITITIADPEFGPMVFDALVAGPVGGPAVLLLHGFPETSVSWRQQMPVLAAAGYRVVAPDQRGYSPRARPGVVEAYRTDRLVADVVDLADALGIDQFHLVGHDWGGAVAWQVAGRHPDRLLTLTVLSTPHPSAFRVALAGEAGRDQGERSGYVQFFRAEGTEHTMLADDAALLRLVYAGSGLSDTESAPYLAAMGSPEALGAALNWYRGADITLVDGLGPIVTPTLYVWSTDDVALGRAAAEATAAFVEGPYRFVALEGIDHWVAEHAPEAVNRLLLEHLLGDQLRR
jgi:pimeloyl-ACP methyl ester carboxylesterase